MKPFVYGDLVFSELHRCYVRVKEVAWDGYIVAMDRNTLKELPDYIHPTQVTFAK